MKGGWAGYYSKRMDVLRERFGGVCVRCGGTKALEFAHLGDTGLWGRGRGLPQRVHDISKNPKRYVLLCKRCHGKFDAGWKLS